MKKKRNAQKQQLQVSQDDCVTEAAMVPIHKTCSDHGIPFIVIKGHNVPTRGHGIWKLNNTLVNQTEYVHKIKSEQCFGT